MNAQRSYREAAVQGATPLELVVRLYEQAVEDLRRITEAIEGNDVTARSNAIKHAILVIGHLQSALDFEQGGAVARNLEQLYNSLRSRLLALQFKPALSGARQITTDLLAVRSAWIEAERVERGKSTPKVVAQPSNPAKACTSDSESAHLDWKA